MTEQYPVIEDNVRIDTVPVVWIGDKPLGECSKAEIQRAFLALVNRVQTLRKRVDDLEDRVYGHP